jgi:hypothetical protein
VAVADGEGVVGEDVGEGLVEEELVGVGLDFIR